MKSTTPKAKPRVGAKRWISTHKAVSITAGALALVLVAGGIYGGIVLTEKISYDNAFTAAHSAIKDYDTALGAANAADAELVGTLTEARDYNVAVSALVAKAPGVFTEETLTEVTDARATLTEAIITATVQPEVEATDKGTATEEDPATDADAAVATEADAEAAVVVELDPEAVLEIETFSVPETSLLVSNTLTATELNETANGINAANTVLDENSATRDGVTTSVTAEVQNLRDALLAAAATAPELSDALLKAAPKAGAAEKEAFAVALDELNTAVEAGDDTLETATVYVDAAVALTKSHTDVVAAEAAAAAAEAERIAQEQGAATYTDPSTGETRQNTQYNSGGGGSSGGGNSGGGNSGGGGSSGGDSGGGNSGGGRTWYPVNIGGTSNPCSGLGSGQEVTYGSVLNPPFDSINRNVYEIPGWGWGMTWQCDTGW